MPACSTHSTNETDMFNMRFSIKSIVMALSSITLPISIANASGRVILFSDSNHLSKENINVKEQMNRLLNKQQNNAPFIYFEESTLFDSPSENRYSAEALIGDSKLDSISISIRSTLTERLGNGMIQNNNTTTGFQYLSHSLATLYTHPLTYEIVKSKKYLSFSKEYLRSVQAQGHRMIHSTSNYA